MIEKITSWLEEMEAFHKRDWDKYQLEHDWGAMKAYGRAKEKVQEVAKEYGKDTNVRSNLDIILDYLQFVRDNADREDFDNKDGWALADLIILATEYQKGE